jgi:hypothetical protein
LSHLEFVLCCFKANNFRTKHLSSKHQTTVELINLCVFVKTNSLTRVFEEKAKRLFTSKRQLLSFWYHRKMCTATLLKVHLLKIFKGINSFLGTMLYSYQVLFNIFWPQMMSVHTRMHGLLAELSTVVSRENSV